MEINIQNLSSTSFGSNVQDNPNKLAMTGIHTISMNAGTSVDSITINGSKIGGPGGDNKGTLTLASDEYIKTIVIRSGDNIDYLSLTTNHGNSITGGGGGGNPRTLSGILVGIAASSGPDTGGTFVANLSLFGQFGGGE